MSDNSAILSPSKGGGDVAITVIGPPRWSAVPDPNFDAGAPERLLDISTDGHITAYSGKVEYGQGIRNGFARLVAAEIGVPVDHVTVVLGDTALVPWDRATVGSASTRTVGTQLRRAAATARAEIESLASAHFAAPVKQIEVVNGVAGVKGDTDHKAPIERLVRDVSTELHIPESPKLRENLEIPTGPRIDAADRVTGKAKFSRDITLPGMLHGKVLRPPTYGAKLQRIDTSRAERVKGVVKVINEDGFVGVVAEREDIAEYAIESIRASWDSPSSDASDWNLPSLLKENAAEPVTLRAEGELDAAFASAERIFDGTYFVPYVANAQMEPSAAVASWDGGKLTLWAGNRGPFTERAAVAEAVGVPESDVHVITAEVGGSFGTKTATVGVEAARLARAAGVPVRITYSREEEFSWSTVRPAALIEIRSGVDANGQIVAWDYIAYHSGENAFRGRRGADTPYATPNVRVAVANSVSPLMSGSYRSLGGAVNHFAREVHIDEIARGLEIDPVEFRLRNLDEGMTAFGPRARFRRALQAAADQFGWDGRLSRGGADTGFGVALGYDAGSFVAQCAEVQVSGGDVKVRKFTAGFDCGVVNNPDGAKNQVEGSIMMGLGTALWEAVEFDGGRILNTGFTRYRVPRISDTPDIDVHLINDPNDPPTGAGEPGIVTVAASVANGVADATGKPVDQLPIVGRVV